MKVTSAAPRPGQSADTAPLRIGVAYGDSSATSSLGINTGGTVTTMAAAQAVLASINAAGGLHGRKLVPSYYSESQTSNDYDEDASTACAQFAQDDHVTVVLDLYCGDIGGFGDCLDKAGILDITTFGGSRAEQTAEPLVFGTQQPTLDASYTSILNALTASGYVTRASKLGIIYDECSGTESALTASVKPLIAKLGLTVKDYAQIACTTGFANAGSDGPTISNAELQFYTDGVDRVMIMSPFESTGLMFFAEDANSQGYDPGYLLSSLADAVVEAANVPSGQLPGFHGFGELPGSDISDPGTPASAVDARCDALSTAGGVSPGTWEDHYIVRDACSPYLLLEAALAGGATDASGLAKAIDNLGTSVALPERVDNRSSFGNGNNYGAAAGQAFSYVTSCSCLRYSGSPAFPT